MSERNMKMFLPDTVCEAFKALQDYTVKKL